MPVLVREATPKDADAVHAVIAEAFADETVAYLWADLSRRDRSMSFVAEQDGTVLGHVGLSWGWADAPARLVDLLILSPLSVAPSAQRTGIGRALVASAVAAADSAGSPALILEGDPSYYQRLGFTPAAEYGFTPPSTRIPPAAFQCVPLAAYEPSMAGPVIYPDTFWAFDSVGLRGDRLARFDH